MAISVLWVEAAGNFFLVVSYFGETEVLRDNLENRIIMDEVETRSAESGWFGISVWGEAIERVLELES